MRRIPLREDDRGVFPIVEAILVAVLVLTAILFFTSVQRPTTAAEEGGLDLGQVADDALRLLQSTQQFGPLDQWVTNLATGDDSNASSNAEAVHRYLAGTRGDGVLPRGTLYQLRLDNGVSSIPILPVGGADAPRGGRAAHVTLLPDWSAFSPEPALWTVHPGESLDPCDQRSVLVRADPAATCPTTSFEPVRCLVAPTDSRFLVDLGDAGAAPDEWVGHWQATPPVDNRLTPPVLWKGNQSQVPSDALYGVWAAYTDSGCTAGVTHFRVVRPDDPLRTAMGTTSAGSGVLTAPAGFFQPTDVGKRVTAIVAGNGTAALPAGATIQSPVANDGTTATASGAALFSSSDVVLTVGSTSPYTPYGLQLVVWFGA